MSLRQRRRERTESEDLERKRDWKKIYMDARAGSFIACIEKSTLIILKAIDHLINIREPCDVMSMSTKSTRSTRQRNRYIETHRDKSRLRKDQRIS